MSGNKAYFELISMILPRVITLHMSTGQVAGGAVPSVNSVAEKLSPSAELLLLQCLESEPPQPLITIYLSNSQ